MAMWTAEQQAVLDAWDEKYMPAVEAFAGGASSVSGSALGSRTVLYDPTPAGDGRQEELTILQNALQTSNDKHLRDSYTLSEVAHTIIRQYQDDPMKYQQYMDPHRKKIPTFNRNTFCGKLVGDFSATKKTTEYGSYVQTHIAHCDSVWLCPTCASVIQTHRGSEVKQAIEWSLDNNYQLAMFTFTASHTAKYKLYDFGKKLQTAYYKTMDSIKKSRKNFEIGNIKSVEFTFSEKNRWHKHFHVLYIYKAGIDLQEIYKKVKKSWEYQCTKVGLLDPSDEDALKYFRDHSLHMSRDMNDIYSSYVTKSASEWKIESKKKNNKWSVENEMTKSVIKIGRNKTHFSPFQILANIAMTDDKAYRKRLTDAFIEYMIHTKGMHQLDWSKGLKALVGIEDKSDSEVMEEVKDTATTVAGLTAAHWHFLRSKHMRIQYFTMLKNLKEEENAFNKITNFFMENGAPLLAESVLTADDVELLENYEDMIDVSDEQTYRFEFLKSNLQTIAEHFNKYSAPKDYKKTEEYIKISDYKKQVMRNKEKSELLKFGINDKTIAYINNLSAEEIAKNRKKYWQKMNYQTSLFA